MYNVAVHGDVLPFHVLVPFQVVHRVWVDGLRDHIDWSVAYAGASRAFNVALG